MKRYDELVLNQLITRYEESLLYTETNRRNMSIRFPIRKQTIPEYFDESSNAYDGIHEQLMQLERRGYVKLIWKNGKVGHILETCVLNLESLEAAYQYLKRSPKREKQLGLEQVLHTFAKQNPVMHHFCHELLGKLARGESVKRYASLDDPEALSELCKLVCCILENQNEIYLREFSVLHFGNTKLVEREMTKAAEIIRRFGSGDLGTLEELSAEQILEEFNILRNPSWVMMKGQGVFRIGNDTVHLEGLAGGMGIHSGDFDKVCWRKEWPVNRVLTIENLTTFHRIQEPDTLIVYLGGYHNRVKRRFLAGIYENFEAAVYQHFGDIDCGGFLIWKNLCERTKIPFETYHMDVEQLEQYEAYGRALTENDRKKLGVMCRDPFFAGVVPVFERMLEMGKKVEQEAIGLVQGNG